MAHRTKFWWDVVCELIFFFFHLPFEVNSISFLNVNKFSVFTEDYGKQLDSELNILKCEVKL